MSLWLCDENDVTDIILETVLVDIVDKHSTAVVINYRLIQRRVIALISEKNGEEVLQYFRSVFTVRRSKRSIVFSIVAKIFLSLSTITHEPLHVG